ncbi:ABC-2 transporter permease [Roseburia inulinivorans]|uniref:ABC-2 transporter permease n=1 Tax=Roseburia inulinivorans TaxID=360807 RepID=A0A3R5ZPZ8_9FIRM|nr:ABC-2 transporter permease [Roseburia inulinivorans]RGR66134.1 ABC-2 transporter permease [Roseburia inulinivorans]
MKGLIRNNFYSMEDSLKLTSAINIMMAIGVSVLGIFNSFARSWIAIVILLQMGSYAVQVASTLQKDVSSQWNKFEITMPVRRKDVVKAKYICFILNGVLGIAAALLTVIISQLLQIDINVEKVFLGITFGIVITFALPALMYPLLLIFGVDKTEMVLSISVILISILFVGSSVIFNYIMPDLSVYSNLVFRCSIIVISIILFIISYMFSVISYKKKNSNV